MRSFPDKGAVRQGQNSSEARGVWNLRIFQNRFRAMCEMLLQGFKQEDRWTDSLLTGNWKLLARICRCRQLHLHIIFLSGDANLWDSGHASGAASETWRTGRSSQSVQHDQEGRWGQPSKILYKVRWVPSTKKGAYQFPIPSTRGKEKLERLSTSDPKTNLFPFCKSESLWG